MPGDSTTAHWSDAELARAWAGPAATLSGAAFDEAYRRFAPALFGTAVGLLRDRERAADVVQDTFVRATTRVGGLREPDRLRSWLFAILRNEVVSAHRAQRRVVASLDEPGSTVTAGMADGGPAADTVVARGELTELVDAASRSLQDRDREVLELHLRAGLDSAEIAEVLGVPAAHGAVLLSRMRDRLAKALGVLLVARSGRRDCPELARLLDGWDGLFTLDLRSRVTRHVEGCRTCSDRRSVLFTPQHLAPAVVLPLAVLPPDLRDRIGTHLVSSPVPAQVPAPGAVRGDGWTWRDDGFPSPFDPAVVGSPDAGGPDAGGVGVGGLGVGSPDVGAPMVDGPRRAVGRRAAVAAAAALLLLGGGTAVVLAQNRGSVADEALVAVTTASAGVIDLSGSTGPDGGASGTSGGSSSGSPSTAGVTASTALTGPGATPPGAAPVTSVRPVAPATTSGSAGPGSQAPSPPSSPTGDGPTTASPRPVSPRPVSPSPVTLSPLPPSPRTPSPAVSPTPALRVGRVAVSPTSLVAAAPPRCAGGQATLTVAATGADPLRGSVTWTQADGTRVTRGLSPVGGGVRGTVGPFTAIGARTLSITITDGAGQRATTSATVTVTRCGVTAT